MTTYDRLRHLVENADLIESIIALDGAVCRRLAQERRAYFQFAGSSATTEGASRVLREISAEEFPRGVQDGLRDADRIAAIADSERGATSVKFEGEGTSDDGRRAPQ
jgi:hypothetical protein